MIGGRYEIKHVIGRGGMGEVLLAEDTILGRPVAIKHLVTTEHGEDAATAGKRLLREAKSAARIHHPNVVAIHDLIQEGDDTYIVMEYVPAKNLEQILRDGPLSVADTAHVGAQVAAALGAAHRLGIVHRDVKPSNILVDEHGVAKLVDFGVARSVGDAGLTQTGLVIGSVAYMPPEVAKGFDATPASDIYSLGATVFAAIEGHAPFAENQETSTPIAVLARLVTSPAPIPTRAGRLKEVITAMLSGNPSDRPEATEVSTQLARLAHPSTSRAQVISAGPADAFDDSLPSNAMATSTRDMSVGNPDDTHLRTHVRHSPSPTEIQAEDDDEHMAPTIIRPRAASDDASLPLATGAPVPRVEPAPSKASHASISERRHTLSPRPHLGASSTASGVLTPFQKQRLKRRRLGIAASVALPIVIAAGLALGVNGWGFGWVHAPAADGFDGVYSYSSVLVGTNDPSFEAVGESSPELWQVTTDCSGLSCRTEVIANGDSIPTSQAGSGFTSEEKIQLACPFEGPSEATIIRRLEIADVQNGQVQELTGSGELAQHTLCVGQLGPLLERSYQVTVKLLYR